MQDATPNHPTPKRLRIFTWYRLVAFGYILLCIPFMFQLSGPPRTPALYFLFPAIVWVGLAAPYFDGAYLLKNRTPLKSYKAARYNRVFLIPIFAAIPTGQLLVQSFLFAEPIALLNWFFLLVTLAISAWVLVTAPRSVRKIRRQFEKAAADWQICFQCGYDNHKTESDACPECGYRFNPQNSDDRPIEAFGTTRKRFMG